MRLQVRQHPFFGEVDWSTPLWQQPSVYTPTLAAPTDTSNFQMNALARVQARTLLCTYRRIDPSLGTMDNAATRHSTSHPPARPSSHADTCPPLRPSTYLSV